MVNFISPELLRAPKADWIARAACRNKGLTDVFFPERGQNIWKAQEYCARCDVRTECLQYAVDNKIAEGVWGGLSIRGRRDPIRVNGEVQIPTQGRIVELWTAGWRSRAIAKELGISEAHVTSSLARYRKARNGF